MAVKQFAATKDTVRAKEGDHPQAKDGGGERHLLAGGQAGFIYTSYVKFGQEWGDVAKINSAHLVLTSERNAHDGWPNGNSGIKVFRLNSEFPDPNDAEPEGSFVGRYPVEGKDIANAVNGTCDAGDGVVNRIDITTLVGGMAPKSVKRPNGKPGGNKPHHGFAIERRTTNQQPNPRMCVGGMRHSLTNRRPYIELNYEPKKSPNTVSTVAPTGDVSDILTTDFEGVFTLGANQPGDARPARWYIELYAQGGSKLWSYEGAASPSDVLDSTCTVPLSLVATTGSRYTFVSGQGYEWRLRAKDNKGNLTDWTNKRTFGIETLPPELSDLRPDLSLSLDTLNNTYFQALYSDPDGHPLLRYQIQLRTQTGPTNPAWGDDLLWDSGPVAGSGFGTQTPGQPTEIRQPYAGVGLEPGTYSWRMRAWDVLDAESAWYYQDLDLTKGWEPDPGDVDLLTGYANRRLKARVLIKGMKNHEQKLVVVGNPDSGNYKLTYDGFTTTAIAHDATQSDVKSALTALPNIGGAEVAVTKDGNKYTVVFVENGTNRPMLIAGHYNNFADGERVDIYSDRAPGRPIAVIEDASNIGASEMYNDGGEFFFSLPAIHPQVAVIEPYQTHYALEVFRGESWREIAAGYIVDFDATADDVVFYGQDYMAILARQVDERFNKKGAADAEAVLWPDGGGGAKYVDRTIKQIIQDQLDRSINDTGSPLAFFTRSGIPDMSEDIAIFVSFKERLPFISGLIESHRAGTGKRTRIYARRTGEGKYQWSVKDEPGRDKPNIRLEYGGLVQGFRVVPFGDFATRLNAIGRLYNSSKLEYYVAHAPTPAGEDGSYYERTYGRFAKTTSYEDISSEGDLRRRAKQASKRMTRVGKALALNLRPGSFAIKDGWDIADSVLVDIKRGVVETTRMGSGYWTIWGWTWELKPNGQELITLSILPKEDSSAPDADLIPPAPIASTRGDWQIEARDPDEELDIDVFTHVNSNTGRIFQRDTTTGLFVDRSEELPFFPTVLIDASLTAERMAPEYKGVWVGASLPPLPDPLYPAGSLASPPSSVEVYQVDPTGMTWVLFEGAEGPAGPPGPEGPPGPPGDSVGDGVEPAVISNFEVSSVYLQQDDGTSLPVLLADWDLLAAPDIIGYELEWQAGVYDTSTPEDPPYVPPDWLLPQSLRVSKEQNTAILEPVLGGRAYDVRIRGYDTEGMVGFWEYASEVVIVPDGDAPAVPSIEATGGYKMLGAYWDRNSEHDLSHYEVRFRPVGGDWVFIDTLSSRITISDLEPGDWEVQVRALDHSLNVQTSEVDPTAVRPSDAGYEEAGWSNMGVATVTLVGQADVVFDTVVADFMTTGTLSADQIIGGSMKVGGVGYTEGLRVYDSLGRPIGAWGEWGWIVADPTSTGRAIWATPQGEMKFTAVYDWDGSDPIEAGIPTTVWTTAIGPDGINAEAITFGSVAGGSNRVLNAGMELEAYPTVAGSFEEWTLASEWDDLTANINLDVSTGDLKMAGI